MPMIFTKSSVKPELIAANKDYMGRNSWDMAFGQIGRQSQIAEQQLSNEYDNAMIQAYISSSAAENAIRSSNLGQGYKDAALRDNQRSLQDAFESYRANYLSQMQEIDTGAAQAASQIHQALDAQASNVAKYTGYAFDYLPYLYQKDPSLFEKDPALARFVNRDENGAITGLKSIDELQEGMFDKNGSMTEAGIDFLNMVQNYGATGNLGQNTFTQFLSEKDKGLLEWLSSADPYSAGKTNRDTFNDIAGTNSNLYNLTPDKLNEENLNHFKSSYSTAHDSLAETYKKGHKSYDDATEFIGKQETATKELIDFAKRMGVAGNEDISALISEAEKNLATYKATIEEPGKGNNRKNREWATSNALADYEELYNAVMNAYNSTGFEYSLNKDLYGDVSVNDNMFAVTTNSYLESKDKNMRYTTLPANYAGSKGRENVRLYWDNTKPVDDVKQYDTVYTWDAKHSIVKSAGKYYVKNGDKLFRIDENYNKDVNVRTLLRSLKSQS